MSPTAIPGNLILKNEMVEADPFFNNVSLLLHGDGANGSTTIVDSSPSPKTVTAFGDAQISTAQSKFGGASLAFTVSAGDRLTATPIAGFALGAADFTLESWLYPTAFTTLYAAWIDFRSGAGFQPARPLIWLGTDGKINFNNTLVTVNALSLNAWTHVALVRSSGIITFYLNGIANGSSTNATSFLCDALNIGATNDFPSTYYYRGYIDDLRITKGIARYTSNFTPPTAPFPEVLG